MVLFTYYLVMTSSIIRIKSIDEIPFHKYTSNDLIAYDLDDTVFVPIDKIMRTANAPQRTQFINDIRSKAGNERVTYTYDSSKYMLVEDCIKEKINKDGLKSIAMTARRTGRPTADCTTPVEDKTLSILKELGISFRSDLFCDVEFDGLSYTNPIHIDNLIDKTLKPFDLPSNAMIKDGVLFTNNIMKGLVIGKLFDHFKFYPDTFVLIDDSEKNHQSMTKEIDELNKRLGLNIKFEGYHYTGATDLLDNTLNPNIVQLQKESLLKDDYQYLSDEMTKKLNL